MYRYYNKNNDYKSNNKSNRQYIHYSKNASSVAIFLEVVHCSVDEYLG